MQLPLEAAEAKTEREREETITSIFSAICKLSEKKKNKTPHFKPVFRNAAVQNTKCKPKTVM